ncbi:glutathione S-transferase, partial [Chytridium lagenaria]
DQKDGEFRRQVSSFRNFVGSEEFPAEKGRYHLYISLACPWAHRALIFRSLKGLEDVISLSVVDYLMGKDGEFHSQTDNILMATLAIPDTVNGGRMNTPKYIREVYFKANPEYSGRFTVPVLWDKKTQTIVNNESSEIIRMFTPPSTNCKYNLSHPSLDLYRPNSLLKLNEINSWIYDQINNGVYKSGFATAQDAYIKNVETLFEGLDRVEGILEGKTWLVGGKLTEADIRLFTTIVRFDPVYHTHFKCNKKTISDNYPNILRWTRQIYQIPGIAETVDMTHIKRHYYMSHIQINPFQIVPVWNGPDLTEPKYPTNIFDLRLLFFDNFFVHVAFFDCVLFVDGSLRYFLLGVFLCIAFEMYI